MDKIEMSDDQKESFEPLFDAIAISATNENGYLADRVLLEWQAHYDEQGRVLLYIHEALVELMGGSLDGETGNAGFHVNLDEIISMLGGSQEVTLDLFCQLTSDQEEMFNHPHVRLTGNWRNRTVVIHIFTEPLIDAVPTYRCMPDGTIQRIIRDKTEPE